MASWIILLLILFLGWQKTRPSSDLRIYGSSTTESLALWMACLFLIGMYSSDWLRLWKGSNCISLRIVPSSNILLCSKCWFLFNQLIFSWYFRFLWMNEDWPQRCKLMDRSLAYYSSYICFPISTIDSISRCFATVSFGFKQTSLRMRALGGGLTLANATGFTAFI